MWGSHFFSGHRSTHYQDPIFGRLFTTTTCRVSFLRCLNIFFDIQLEMVRWMVFWCTIVTKFFLEKQLYEEY